MTEKSGDSYFIARWQIYVEKLPERIEAHPAGRQLAIVLHVKQTRIEFFRFLNSSLDQKNRSQKIKSVPYVMLFTN